MEDQKASQEDEESDLEQEIEEEEKDEKIDPKKLQKFIQQRDFFPNQEVEVEDNSPSLERRNISQNIPVRLEKGVSESNSIKENKKDDFFKYNSKISQEDEPKYQNRDDNAFIPKQTNIQDLGKTDFSHQQVGFVNAQKNTESANQEKYDIVEQQDIASLGKNENPFTRKEIKYKPSEKPLS